MLTSVMPHKKWEHCRLCGANPLETVLDFGQQGLPQWQQSATDVVPIAPLEFCVCPRCLLGQLRHSIDRENLFREYWYRTGINSTMRQHMAGVASAATKEAALAKDDVVVDIGCNDGTLLLAYASPGAIKVGFEPSNLCRREREAGFHWVNDFFDPTKMPDAVRSKAKVVTTMSMFYYFDDPIGFAREIKSILRPDGIWVCEMNYAGDMISQTTFDHISHEHVTVWSGTTFSRVVKEVGLEIFRMERNSLNGGSIRFWMAHPGQRSVEPSVASTLAAETKAITLEAYRSFAHAVRNASGSLGKILQGMRSEGKRVMCYGASTRGLTILGAAGVGADVIEAAVERNAEKVGRYYGNTRIPIISEEQMRQNPPDALLILPYSFVTEFVDREGQFLERGGRFIVPVPTPHLIDHGSRSRQEAVR